MPRTIRPDDYAVDEPIPDTKPVGKTEMRMGVKEALNEALRRMDGDPDLKDVVVLAGSVTLKSRKIANIAVQIRLREEYRG